MAIVPPIVKYHSSHSNLKSGEVVRKSRLLITRDERKA
jgi:hypothetical protein